MRWGQRAATSPPDGESGQAREYWERALELNPDNEAARALMSPETGV